MDAPLAPTGKVAVEADPVEGDRGQVRPSFAPRMGHESGKPECGGPIDLAQWRASALRQLALLLTVTALTCSLALALLDVWQGSVKMSPWVLGATCLLGLATWVPGLPRWICMALMSAAVLGAASVALDTAYYRPNAFVAVAVLCAIQSACGAERAAWLSLAGFVVAFGVAAYLFTQGATLSSPERVDVSQGWTWMRVGSAFVLCTAVVITAVGLLTRQLGLAVERSQELYRALEIESAEKVAALERQHQANALLHRAQRADNVGRLAAGMAHDFNNLLVVVLTNAALLKQGDERPELNDIELAGARAARLAQRLLAFGRGYGIGPGATDASDCAHRCADLLRAGLKANTRLEVRADRPALVGLDAVEVDQIIVNLCLNGFDSLGKSGGSVELSTSLVEHVLPRIQQAPIRCVRIRVRDSGAGMAAETQRRLFEPFFSTKAPDRGTGLGLTVVRQLVERVAGVLEWSSKLGEGTTFDIYLPSYTTPRNAGSSLV